MIHGSAEYKAAQETRNQEFLERLAALLREFNAELEHDVEYVGHDASGSVLTVSGDNAYDVDGNIVRVGVDVRIPRYFP